MSTATRATLDPFTPPMLGVDSDVPDAVAGRSVLWRRTERPPGEHTDRAIDHSCQVLALLS